MSVYQISINHGVLWHFQNNYQNHIPLTKLMSSNQLFHIAKNLFFFSQQLGIPNTYASASYTRKFETDDTRLTVAVK